MRKLLYHILLLTLSLPLIGCYQQPAAEEESRSTTRQIPAEHPSSRARLASSDDDLLRPPSIPDLISGESGPATAEEAREQLGEATNRWFYGQGLGTTILNVGTVVVFPPYAIYLLGNAGLALAGFEPLYMTDALPEEVSDPMLLVYDNFTEVPGRVTAAVSREKFHSRRYPDQDLTND